jgi:hypothetical protein
MLQSPRTMNYYGRCAMPGLPAAIHLANDELELVFKGKTQRLPCVVELETDPRPRLSFRIDGANPLMGFGSERRFSVHIVRADVTCAAFIAYANNGIVGLLPEREPIAVGHSNDLSEVHFDLINFPSFWALSSPSTRLPDNQLDVAADGWRVEIRPARHSPEIEAFRSTLYSVTHSCVIRRHNDEAFTSEQAQNLLNVLHDALSFAAGRWVTAALVRGFGSDQQVLWTEWGTRPLHPNLGTVETWFDTHHANVLSEILPGFLQLQNDAERAETFHSALYWYNRSTGLGSGVDGGIILLQAALELLSWQTFVRDRKALSPDGFGRLPADDQLRLLIESSGIPTSVPVGLSDLAVKAKEMNWSDGPKALTGVRNLLTHPERHKHLKHLPFYDAWRLAEWYVELVLLRMLNFSGEYSNRTKAQGWVGSVDRVPWAST